MGAKELAAKAKIIAKEHYYIAILLLLSLFFFHSILSTEKILTNVHYVNDVTFYSHNVKKALSEGTLPLWTPYYYSGRPLFAQPEYYFIDFNLLVILLTGNIYLAMNFSVIIHLFLAGLGMCLLVNYLSQDKKAAFISALVFMFNGFLHVFILRGNIMIMEGYSLIPFMLLFTIKALRQKNFVLNSIIAGLFVALTIFVGGVIFLPYIALMIAAYSIIYLIDKNFTSKLIKLAIVGIIILAVGVGVSAIKLLPGIEFIKLSNRGLGVPYQEYLGEPVKINDFAYSFITNLYGSGSISAAVGIFGFLLMLWGLYRYRSRPVLFSGILILMSLLLSTESFLSKFLFNVPVFNQTRHIERAVVLFAFGASILAGFGFLSLQSFMERFRKISKKTVFIAVIILLLFELVLVQKVPQSAKAIGPEDIGILKHMGKDSSLFRTINLGLSTLIGATGYNYYAQYGISEIKGGSGIWFNDYLAYLSVAQNAPAKFWGVLNNKYAVIDKKTEIENLKLIGRFEPCKECTVWEAFGPYLYENELFLPRYYAVPNGILVVGNNELVQQLTYGLMLQNWNPNSTVLIQGTKINDYGIDFLKKFKMILLVRDSVDDNSIPKLREYVSQGGIIIPDILSGQLSVSANDMESFFNQTTGNYTGINAAYYSNNKVILDLKGEKGWLVASERFAHFPGWKANLNNNKVEMLKADNIITAVYLDGQSGELVFEYGPKPYRTGKIISSISALILITYFGYLAYSRFLKGGKNQA
ncbi:hypothetical protein HYX06_04710 [Candidatus Woesearchaeota archaeon]|nr:hypothetical protein [Candidatus Woesearchaeota archaeon]